MSGLTVPIHPNFTNRTYSGITVTWNGSMIVDSTTRNAACRPRQRIRESA
jgi:hypothetical protein